MEPTPRRRWLRAAAALLAGTVIYGVLQYLFTFHGGHHALRSTLIDTGLWMLFMAIFLTIYLRYSNALRDGALRDHLARRRRLRQRR